MIALIDMFKNKLKAEYAYWVKNFEALKVHYLSFKEHVVSNPCSISHIFEKSNLLV